MGAGIGNLFLHDQGVRCLTEKIGHRFLHPALDQVVAQKHEEGIVTQVGAGRFYGVGQAQGFLLDDAGDLKQRR